MHATQLSQTIFADSCANWRWRKASQSVAFILNVYQERAWVVSEFKFYCPRNRERCAVLNYAMIRGLFYSRRPSGNQFLLFSVTCFVQL